MRNSSFSYTNISIPISSIDNGEGISKKRLLLFASFLKIIAITLLQIVDFLEQCFPHIEQQGIPVPICFFSNGTPVQRFQLLQVFSASHQSQCHPESFPGPRLPEGAEERPRGWLPCHLVFESIPMLRESFFKAFGVKPTINSNRQA